MVLFVSFYISFGISPFLLGLVLFCFSFGRSHAFVVVGLFRTLVLPVYIDGEQTSHSTVGFLTIPIAVEFDFSILVFSYFPAAYLCDTFPQSITLKNAFT